MLSTNAFFFSRSANSRFDVNFPVAENAACLVSFARKIILARATVKYDNVYLLARCSNSSRSCLVRRISYGLLRGKIVPSRHQHNKREGHSCQNYTLLYLCNGVLSFSECRACIQSARWFPPLPGRGCTASSDPSHRTDKFASREDRSHRLHTPLRPYLPRHPSRK